MSDLSRSQIQRLGRRLRHGEHTPSDLELLSALSAEFAPVLLETMKLVEEIARRMLQDEPQLTGRTKQLRSIVDKLQRSATELGRMQDIVGCRLVVANRADQEGVVAALQDEGCKVNDFRDLPHFGYWAIHVIRVDNGRRCEIQVRTTIQHAWAEMSETFDRQSPGLKYGGGDPMLRSLLGKLSVDLREAESAANDTDAARIVSALELIRREIHGAGADMMDSS